MAGRGTMLERDMEVIDKNVFLLDDKGEIQPATNPLNQFSSIRKEMKMQQISPGYSFAKRISAATGRKILLVVNARGGSSLYEWVKGAEKKFYDEAVRRTHQALAHGGKLKAILWHQGESNSRDTTYLRNLAGMVQDLRTEFGDPDLPFIAGELAHWRSSSPEFNKRLTRISEYISNSDFVSAKDCSMLKGPKDPHFGRDGQILLGERYAAKVIKMCYKPDYSKLTAENHPRLFINEETFEILKKKAAPGSIISILNKNIIGAADWEIKAGKDLIYQRDASGKRILSVSRNALKRISSCAYAYKLTGNSKYLTQAEKDMNSVCAFKDWNHSHFLDVAEMCMALAIGYDWLYKELSEDTKENVRTALKKNAFDHTGSRHCWFYTRSNNWNQVCNGGLVAASLATYESNPEIAERLIEAAVESNAEPIKNMYYPDGNYTEGYGYWDYGTTYQCLMLTALENTIGTDFGLSQTEGFLKTGEFMMFMEGVTESFNFFDNNGQKSAQVAMWYFADKLGNPDLLYNEICALREGKKVKKYSGQRLLAPIMGYAARINLDKISAPKKKIWYGHGDNPVVLIRTEWDGSEDDIYLGIKGGKASASHGHMDAGSFVYDYQGVRWACDLGMQNYAALENAMKKIKKNLWVMDQESARWDILRYNNFHHNTITLNDSKHYAEGFARIREVIEKEDEMGAVIDMTEVLKDHAESATRTIRLLNERNLEVADQIVAPADKGAKYSWRMVTNGVPVVKKKMIILTADDKTMYLKAEGNVKFKYCTWSAEPKKDYDVPNEGKYIVGIEAEVPQGKTADFKVTLTPDK